MPFTTTLLRTLLIVSAVSLGKTDILHACDNVGRENQVLFKSYAEFCSDLQEKAIEKYKREQIEEESIIRLHLDLPIEKTELLSYLNNAKAQDALVCLKLFQATDKHIKMLTPYLDSIKILDLSCSEITNTSTQFLRKAANLTDLRLGSQIGKSGLKNLAQSPNLRSLELQGENITNECIRALAHSQTLKELRLYFTGITDKAISDLVPLNLEVLDLLHADITDKGIQDLAQQTSGLEFLGLRGTKVTDAGIKALTISGLNVKGLDLIGTKVTDKGLKAITTAFPNLEILSLNQKKITDDGAKTLNNLKKLKRLDLRCPNITAQGLSEIDAPDLGYLYLEGANITDDIIAHFAQTSFLLRGIKLVNTQITPECMRIIGSISPCIFIQLSGVTITDEYLHCLQGYSSVDFSKSAITDQGMNKLVIFSNPTHLNLSKTALTDSGLKILSVLSGLKSIALKSTAVTDAGISFFISKIDRLESVDLCDTKITDNSLMALVIGVPNLKFIDVSGTEVTNDGVLFARALKPELTLIKDF